MSQAEARELGLDREHLVRIYRDMLATRLVEERGNLLFKAGKLPGSYYTGRGNEAASVGVAAAMGPDDVGAPLHRNMGVLVARGVPPAAVFCQFMGRDGGATRGRDSNLRSNDFGPGKGLLAGVSHLPVMTGIIAGRWLTPARRPFPGPKSLERRFESRPRVAPPPRPMNWQKIAAGGMPRTRWTPRFR